jgi:hypothetical protein
MVRTSFDLAGGIALGKNLQEANSDYFCQTGTGADSHSAHSQAAAEHVSAMHNNEKEGKQSKADAHEDAADAHHKAAKSTGDDFQKNSAAARNKSWQANNQ